LDDGAPGARDRAAPESSEAERASGVVRRPFSIAIDPIAEASLQSRHTGDGAPPLLCDQCGDVIEGEPFGRGLYLWTRGEEMRFEEPALCSECAVEIGVTANQAWSIEEDEG
jgi:hypothetical protein